MGMFDSFYAKAKCPYCKVEKEREFQTKLAGKTLSVYYVGDKIDWSFVDLKDVILKDGFDICDCGGAIEVDILIQSNVFKRINNIRKAV